MPITSIGQAPLLQIENLTIAYRQGRRLLDAVRDVSLTIGVGETVGLVGESGSGKSTLAHGVLRFLSDNGAIRRGRILFQGQDLVELTPPQLRRYWREQVKLVPQNALSSLNPSLTIGDQVMEALPPQDGRAGSNNTRSRMLDLLDTVRLADPARVAASYPHQLSGGMQQRVMIAMALAAEPALLVMDEPTTALDVTTEAAILDLVAGLIRERQTAVLYVTHDLSVVAQVCDRVAVLYAGELVEEATVPQLFAQPLHPYTGGLLAGVPQVGLRKGTRRLNPIQGNIPQLTELPPACVFAPRCPIAIDRCHVERPPREEPPPQRGVRCFRWHEIAAGTVTPVNTNMGSEEYATGPPQSAGVSTPSRVDAEHAPVLQVTQLEKRFSLPKTPAQWLSGKPAPAVRAVDGVDLTIGPGRTLGLVGESGSGKTTLARCIIGLEEATGGEMRLLDVPLAPALNRRAPALLRQLQIVFQNPDEALNPYRTVADTLRRPLARAAEQAGPDAQHADLGIDARIQRLLAMVNLRPELVHRLPGQLSGGEKQRVAIARAFAVQPELLIFDESVSALDVSVQASILNLLNELQAEQGRAYLFITHDLGVVSYVADEVAVIYLGRLMEVGQAQDFFAPPYHPYTEALLAAAPRLPNFETGATPASESAPVDAPRVRLQGEIPSPSPFPSGCPFHTRCPRSLGRVCETETPPWRTGAPGHRIFCHIPLEELEATQGKG